MPTKTKNTPAARAKKVTVAKPQHSGDSGIDSPATTASLVEVKIEPAISRSPVLASGIIGSAASAVRPQIGPSAECAKAAKIRKDLAALWALEPKVIANLRNIKALEETLLERLARLGAPDLRMPNYVN